MIVPIGMFGLGLALADAQMAPLADMHQHLFSPAAAALVSPASGPLIQPITAKHVIQLLDEAGIRRALVLSVAYTFGNPNRNVEEEYEKVKAENDWTSQQAAQFPDRLRAFCSFNPLKDYALEELARCARDPRLRRGLKLHFGNSDVDYQNLAHIERVRAVLQAANRNRMAVVIHMRASITNQRAYGPDEARIFLDQLLPAAPDVPIQIAHMAGAGGYDEVTDQAVGVFADAIRRKDVRTRRLYFDVTSVVAQELAPEQNRRISARLRQLGVGRVLYGSDADGGGNPHPKELWAMFRKLDLSEAEFRTIARNLPPYIR
jgi:predicted TIM-barrel fold metal-dependent hydrolase